MKLVARTPYFNKQVLREILDGREIDNVLAVGKYLTRLKLSNAQMTNENATKRTRLYAFYIGTRNSRGAREKPRGKDFHRCVNFAFNFKFLGNKNIEKEREHTPSPLKKSF